MVADYDASEGIFGFQEYEGSLREENIDGEPRFFRTFVGPSTNRMMFLKQLFGLQYITWVSNVPCTNPVCDNLLTYPTPHCFCVDDPIGGEIIPDTVMVPVSYRIEPHDSTYSHTLGTVTTVSGGVAPQVDCGVLIEVEYRHGIASWPEELHDGTFTSTRYTDVAYQEDVPPQRYNSYYRYEEEHAVQFRVIKGRNFAVASHAGNPATFPSVANPNGDNKIETDGLDNTIPTSTCEFSVTWMNSPYVPRTHIRNALGAVNGDVWFGYPSHGVSLAGVQITPKVHLCGTWIYDIKYDFMAWTVPADGEVYDLVVRTADIPIHGQLIWNGRVGVYNRVWWPYAIPGTAQHWWPIGLATQVRPDLATSWSAPERPFGDYNFHLLFDYPAACAEE